MSKFSEHNLSFATVCALDRQIQYNCSKDPETYFKLFFYGIPLNKKFFLVIFFISMDQLNLL
jgi:hypothetical protein